MTPLAKRACASAALSLAGILAGEALVRLRPPSGAWAPRSAEELIAGAGEYSALSARERENRYILHNVALFSGHPGPETVRTLFVGSSRTKLLLPHRVLGLPAVVAGGNSYNELPYGTLVEASILRRMFPGLKTVFVEASLLMRRAGYRVEPDHRKYLFALAELEPLRRGLPGAGDFTRFLAEGTDAGFFAPGSVLFGSRRDLRLAAVLGRSVLERPEQRPASTPEMLALDEHGERKELPGVVHPARRPPPIEPGHEKLRRVKDARLAVPGDRAFELWALWARRQGLELVLYDPPVRGDFLAAARPLGLEAHHRDLRRLSDRYGIPVVILNDESLGYSGRWDLFSDHDHMGTCLGASVLTAALWEAYRDWKRTGERDQRVPLAKGRAALGAKAGLCPR